MKQPLYTLLKDPCVLAIIACIAGLVSLLVTKYF